MKDITRTIRVNTYSLSKVIIEDNKPSLITIADSFTLYGETPDEKELSKQLSKLYEGEKIIASLLYSYVAKFSMPIETFMSNATLSDSEIKPGTLV